MNDRVRVKKGGVHAYLVDNESGLKLAKIYALPVHGRSGAVSMADFLAYALNVLFDMQAQATKTGGDDHGHDSTTH